MTLHVTNCVFTATFRIKHTSRLKRQSGGVDPEMSEPSHPTSPPPAATPAPAAPKSAPTSPSQLSPNATPFFPSSLGRSKTQRWAESPLSVGDESSDLEPFRPSYKDVLTRERSPAVEQSGRQPWTAAVSPTQPPRVRMRSEIHRVHDAAPGRRGLTLGAESAQPQVPGFPSSRETGPQW